MSSKSRSEYDKMDLPQIQERLQKINFGAPGKKAENAVKQIMEAALKKGIMPKQALQISDDTMEAIYTQAYTLYNQSKYRDASYIFRLLMLLDFTTPKYVLGLAACAHRVQDFTNAANLYFLCAALDPDNPIPHFHSTDCYLQLGAKAIASYSLQLAIEAAGDQPQYQTIKQRAELMKEALDKQLEAQPAPVSEEAQ
ncbi:MAG: SycD/LcrH family type III secretion system chaperone [Verrucomicrobia bacterium]|nr:SycD/LcrH family type III secretion system chaperone [Verrucomicrobiota bacterium]